MIEIVPHSDSFRGSYNVASAVDTETYLYIYNEVFVKEWNQYIKIINAVSDFVRLKWIIDESESANDVLYETLSHRDKVGRARKVSEFTESRRGTKGRYFQKLVNDFDRKRSLIVCYNTKFYTYTIEGKFADHVSVYLIEEGEITYILNHLYLRLNKRNRVVEREKLFDNFGYNDED